MLAWALPVVLLAGAPCPTESMRLDWVRADAAASCPAGEEVVRFVQQRLQCSPFASEANAWFEVYIEPAESGWQAKLRRNDAEGRKLKEKVLHSTDSNCAVLGEVVALTLAVVADQLPQVPVLANATTTTVTLSATATVTRSSPQERVVVRPQNTQAAEPVVAIAPRGTIAVDAVLNAGTMPSAAWGVRGSGSLQLGHRLSAELGVLVLPVRAVDSQFYGLTAVSLGACAHFEPPGVRLEACARFYGGVFMGFVGSGVTAEEPGSYPWFGGSVGGGLSLPLVGPVFIRLGVEALITFVNRIFTESAQPDAPELHNEAPIALLGSAGLSVRFR